MHDGHGHGPFDRPIRAASLLLVALLLAGIACAQTGELVPSDPRSGEGRHYHELTFQGDAGESWTVSLRSGEFDVYATIVDPLGATVLEVDDSAGEGLNVREVVRLETAGMYTVRVTSAFPGETGRYALSLERGEPGEPAESGDATLRGMDTPREPNVVAGRVGDAGGAPLSGARVTVSGTTDGGADMVETFVSDAQGRYRGVVPSGRYDVSAEADVMYDGATYRSYLHPADGACHEETRSDEGIVRDFVFRAEGLKACLPGGTDTASHRAYAGGTVAVTYAASTSRLDDAARVTFVLTPLGPLADGSRPETLTFTRSVGSLRGQDDAPGDGGYLFDVPLGRYEIRATATRPDGGRAPVAFGDPARGDGSARSTIGFEPYATWPYGIRVTNVTMYDAPDSR